MTTKIKTLSRDELEQLLCVPTTVEQATMIRERNTGLLEVLNRGEEAETYVGCPHCPKALPQCDSCAWNACLERRYLSCIYQTFGGVAIETDPGEDDDLELIEYGYAREAVLLPDHMYPPVVKEAVDKARSFLLGHIEWSEIVIALGGTVPEDWRTLTDEQRSEWTPLEIETVEQKLEISYEI